MKDNFKIGDTVMIIDDSLGVNIYCEVGDIGVIERKISKGHYDVSFSPNDRFFDMPVVMHWQMILLNRKPHSK